MLDGQIKYADNPKVVYEGDLFEPYEDEHGTRVKYAPKVPRASNKIIACFIKITRNDSTVDYKWLFSNDMERLASYSLRKNSRGFQKKDKDGNVIPAKANALYSSGEDGQADAGFWEAKTIKHAFKSYPKMRIGTRATVVQTQKEEIDVDAITYGDVPEALPPATEAELPITPSEVVSHDTPEPMPQSMKADEPKSKKGQGYL